MKNRWLLSVLFLLMGLLLVACGGNTMGSMDMGGNKGAAKATGTQQVQIMLTEYKITSSINTFKPDVDYHFVIMNNGKLKHEFMIMPKDLGAMNGMSMSDMDKVALAQVEGIQPGQTRTLDYTFRPADSGSHPQFGCFYPGHYDAGMKLTVAVS